ncbi:uncharacterized protein LOC131348305 isoform X1 [Hemibagrus wyckioides]|uniref:uncharacterized protein LOC131348305 isoform X1 n=1 Tax=Hemibagrus wyckioides TaxID=337641 RepID=UPI00266D0F34|nr:uncharacterized protein LOC131348305 isoform X1 [Hemibagrus wyckioides]
MEMQQRHSRTQNVYDMPEEQTKTEEVYQTLQHPPKVSTRNAPGKKITVLLIIMNILLITILLVTVIHYYHFRHSASEVLNNQKTNQGCHLTQSEAEILNNQKSNQEIWYLHDGTFYLFWSDHGDCQRAEQFCADRTANLAVVTKSNMDWLQSQIHGKHMLVQINEPQRSGDGFHYDMVDYVPDCELFGATSDVSKRVEGWVCEKAMQWMRF